MIEGVHRVRLVHAAVPWIPSPDLDHWPSAISAHVQTCRCRNMASKLPIESGFTNVPLSITPPPASQPPTNVLILLHGLGDGKEAFKTLGEQLALPETACISIQGPSPVPFNIGGAHWGDDLIFDSSAGELDFDTGFKKATELIAQRVLRTLLDFFGRDSNSIYILGFGQGGMAALASVASMPVAEELGGLITIGGALPAEVAYPIAKNRTPVLALGGSSGSQLTAEGIERIKRVFAFVEYKPWSRPGDSMPRNREEMLPIMQFFGRVLKSRQGVPEGSIELA